MNWEKNAAIKYVKCMLSAYSVAARSGDGFIVTRRLLSIC